MLPSFESHNHSHQHSLATLELLEEFTSFMESIDTVVDMGCGYGHDVFWWATRRDPEPPHVPRNYNVIGVDNTVSRQNPNLANCANVEIKVADFETVDLPAGTVDLLWCHNSFHFVKNPLATLQHWNSLISNGGFIYLCLPYTVNRHYNQFSGKTQSHSFFHYMPSNIIYMLACAGFDLSDSRFVKFDGDVFFHIAGYKDTSKVNYNLTWYELAETGRLPSSLCSTIQRKGYVDDYELVGEWFNGSRCSFDKQ